VGGGGVGLLQRHAWQGVTARRVLPLLTPAIRAPTPPARRHKECYEHGQLVEVAFFDRAALEFGGSYACRAEEAAGRCLDGLFCEPQWEA
jgi:hypothetical protein